MKGLAAFQGAFMSSDSLDGSNFSDYQARYMRYEIMWALYENTVFNKVHKWSTALKADYGLYKFIRNIYNPSYRIGEFWKAHLYGGQLDSEAGDGKTTPSAIPIMTDNDDIRPALSELWRASNWALQKDILSLRGSILGDAVIKVVDNPIKGRVSLHVVHPGTLESVTLDEHGNIKGYVIEESRYPDDSKKVRIYREECTRDGINVVYKTTLDGKPYSDVEGEPAEWDEPYGFVPMVKIQHNNVGLDWGWSELFPGFAKFREIDDLASKLSDQVRKMVDSPWLLSGVEDPAKKPLLGAAKATPVTTGTPAINSSGVPSQKAKQELPILYGPPNSNAIAMVSPLSISETVAYIESILKDIEKDYPELTVNTQNLQGDITGRALRVNQQPVVERVLQRRANYDDALIRAQKMALAIGGFRNYKGYQGFGLDSYEAGKLDHSIGSRPVFGRDPMDDYDLEGKLWEVAKEANDLGVPLDVFLEMKGWEKDRIDKIVQSPSYQAKIEALNNLRKMANGNNDDQGSQSGNQSGLESRFAKKDQKDGATSNA